MLHIDVSDEGTLYQVQELVEGETLQARMQRSGAWAPGIAARVVAVLADALAAAHAQGIVHRDVKPANVMLTPKNPGLKLLDFGISKLYEDAHGGGGTVTGAIIGTPPFMSPEQLVVGPVTDRSDVYAAGIMLFMLLTGEHPFGHESMQDMLRHHLGTPAPRASSVRSSVPPVLCDLVDRCLAKKPADRPSAAELAALLERFATEEGVVSLALISREETERIPQAELPASPVGGERTAVEVRRPRVHTANALKIPGS
jgi:serine/threonine-protein kinase